METAITKVADGRASAEFSGTLAQGRVVAEADQQRRRRPRIIDADWLVMRGLSRLVDCYAARLAKTSRSAIDLGCGNQPYRPYFENRGVAYLGADFDGSADILITPDGRIDAAHSSVDLVLSFQVLEHVRRWAVNCWKAICGPLAWGTIVRLTGCCCAERRIALIRGVLDGPLSPVKNLRAACDDAVASRGISDRNACVYLVQALVQGGVTLQRLGNLFSYGMTGALCAGLHFLILVLGDALGVHFALLVTVSFVVCAIVGYLLHCRFTFEIAPTLKELGRYTLAMTGNYPLSLAIVWLANDRLGLPMIIAAPLSTVLLTAYNFLSSRWAVAHSLARQIDGAAKT